MKKFISIAMLLITTSCTLGPDYFRPDNSAQEQPSFINSFYEENKDSSVNRWWEEIDDPLLKGYVAQLLQENLALEQAAERVIQARERVRGDRGAYYPTLGTDINASRNFTTNTNSNRSYSNLYSAELETSWQIDLFGKISSSVDSSIANFEASKYDKEALVHSLIAELLNRRVAVAINKKLLDLAKQNSDNRRKTYDIVKNRYDIGARGTQLSDVYLAKENYTSVEADIHEFERLLAEETYKLDVLLGQAPGTTKVLESEFPLLTPPVDVPVCVPADLLDRRPDLRSSELRLAASTADIGVAIADLYPSINLGGSIGVSGTNVDNLFSTDQLVGSVLGSVMTKIFQGGTLRANIRIQESEAREQAAKYANDILEAMREVETALKAEKELVAQLESVAESAEALKMAEEISQERYIRGVLTLKEFLDVQQRRYLVEQNYLNRQKQKWNTRTALYLALGGDWLGAENKETNECRTEGLNE